MQSRQRAVVTRVHRLQHIQGFRSAAFADHDALRTHAQCVANQFTNRHLRTAVSAGFLGFQRNHMVLRQFQFGRVLNGHDPLIRPDATGQDIQQSCFPRPRSAGHDDIQPRLHACSQKFRDERRQRTEIHQVLHGQPVAAEFTNRKARPPDRHRRNHDVHARAIRQTRIHQRIASVQRLAQRTSDPFDHLPEMRLIVENDLRPHRLAVALDVNPVGAVHHHFGDTRVFQKRLDRTKPIKLVDHRAHQRGSNILRQTGVGGPQRVGELFFDFFLCGGFGDGISRRLGLLEKMFRQSLPDFTKRLVNPTPWKVRRLVGVRHDPLYRPLIPSP